MSLEHYLTQYLNLHLWCGFSVVNPVDPLNTMFNELNISWINGSSTYFDAMALMNLALTNTNCDFYDTRTHRLSMRKQIFKLYVTMQLLTFWFDIECRKVSLFCWTMLQVTPDVTLEYHIFKNEANMYFAQMILFSPDIERRMIALQKENTS